VLPKQEEKPQLKNAYSEDVSSHWVRKYFGNYCFVISGIMFFPWFQLEVETFQVGWAVPAKAAKAKAKAK